MSDILWNGDRIRRFRRKRGWSQAQLAVKLGVRVLTVSRWERGVSLPSQLASLRLNVVSGEKQEEASHG